MTTKADIVERLRGAKYWCRGSVAWAQFNDDAPFEAADLIEKHRAAIAPTDANVERLARVLMSESNLDPNVFVGMHGQLGHFGDTVRAILDAQNETIGE